ncbi:methionine/alanine import family NSS transporter small subunit [Egicoccus halophilus]|nr:methionine/alanine import family NSS transporter small subunit [Egicoccus halophilus]
MTTPAIALMVVALLLVWGGLVASVTFAVVRSRQRRSAGDTV